MIYQGLRPEFFYWEFVNLLRKAFIVIVNVALSTFPSIFKAMLCLMVLLIFWRILKHTKPYRNPLLNNLEERENMT